MDGPIYVEGIQIATKYLSQKKTEGQEVFYRYIFKQTSKQTRKTKKPNQNKTKNFLPDFHKLIPVGK